MTSGAGTTEEGGVITGIGDDDDAPPVTTPFDMLFARAYPAAVGLARRVLDRDQVAPTGSGALANDVATEALTRAAVQKLSDTDGALRRIMGWTADLCVGRLVGHPGRVALPEGARAVDLLPQDLLDDGIGVEWDQQGLPLAELQIALVGSRRRDRRVGLVCLGAGLSPMHTAALLGLERGDVDRRVRRIGIRLADLRRVDAGMDGPLDAPAEEVAWTATSAGTTESSGAPAGRNGAPNDPAGASPTAAVVAGLAVGGLDLRTARGVVAARARRRLRFRRGVMAGFGAIVVVGLAVLVIPRDEPNDVIADADTTTTTEASSTTLPPDTVPVTTVAPVTTAVTTTTLKKPPVTFPVVTTTVPPPTIAPNQPMTASATVAGTPTVGDTVEVTVQWSDPDFADPAGMEAAADWGDSAVTLPVAGDVHPACGAPGPGGSATIPLRFRYATPGPKNVRIELTACDGQGAYGEDRVLSVPITVAAAPQTDRVVVVGGALGTRSPDAAVVSGPSLHVDPRAELGQVDSSGGRVTVFRVPATYVGDLQFHWGTDCQAVAVGASSPVALMLRQDSAAAPAGTGSTVP